MATGVPEKMFNATLNFVERRTESNKNSEVFTIPMVKGGFKISNHTARVIAFLDIFFHGEI